MLDFVQMLDYCADLAPIINLVKAILGIIQFGIPIVLVLLGTIDLGKAVMSSDDKEVKAAQGRLIKRCIYAALVFFVVFLVNLIMKIVSNTGVNGLETDSKSWYDCWSEKSE